MLGITLGGVVWDLPCWDGRITIVNSGKSDDFATGTTGGAVLISIGLSMRLLSF